MINPSEYKERRKRIFDEMENDSIAILFAGVPVHCSSDEDYPFEVNRNFYYLTGIDQEDSSLILVKTDGEEREYLLVSPFNPVKEKWYGRKLTVDEASEKSGVRNVLLSNALSARVDSALTGNYSDFAKISKVYLDLEKGNKIQSDTYPEDYRRSLETAYPGIEVFDIYPIIVSKRKVKSPAEIEELREAIAATKIGISAAMSRIRPGVKEYEVANEFHHAINDISGYQGTAFPTILASGVHTTCLHYPTPVDTIKKDSLVLMDLGSRSHYYCADVSRTVPSNGKFTPLQKTVYEIVLGCNKAVANYARPGLTISDLQSFTIEYLASECLNKGLISSKDEIKEYYFHGVSHFIGLDTHDPGERKEPLAPGNVISNEPGLYFKDLAIGVRIEDDLLITKDGAEVLTKDIIKEVSEIEAFYSHAR